MKKIIVLCIAMAFGMTVIAQVEPIMEKQGITRKQKIENCYLMKDGKVWVVKDGNSTILINEVTLNNGTTVKPEGTVITMSGETTVLEEGDKVYSDGRIEKAASKKNMGENEDYDNINKK